jgi:hypothetical protein
LPLTSTFALSRTLTHAGALSLAHAASLAFSAATLATATFLRHRGPAAQRCNQYRNHQHALGHHLPLHRLRTNEKFIS